MELLRRALQDSLIQSQVGNSDRHRRDHPRSTRSSNTRVLVLGTVVSYMQRPLLIRPVDFVHPVEAVIPGVQGRVLAVLVETTAELSLRTLARLAGVSVAQASRVLPGLVELGLVERREVPPSSQFRLVRSNVGARAVINLAHSRNSVLESIGVRAAAQPIPPTSVIVFGSFARGGAGRDSDVDVVVVRPDEISEDDEDWSASIESWRNEATATAGNTVQILEVSVSDAQSRLRSKTQLWRDIRRDGVVIHGSTIGELSEAIHA